MNESDVLHRCWLYMVIKLTAPLCIFPICFYSKWQKQLSKTKKIDFSDGTEYSSWTSRTEVHSQPISDHKQDLPDFGFSFFVCFQNKETVMISLARGILKAINKVSFLYSITAPLECLNPLTVTSILCSRRNVETCDIIHSKQNRRCILNDYITCVSYFQVLSLCINKSVWQFPKYLYIKNHCQRCPKACQTVNIQSNCSIKYFLRGLILNDRQLLSLYYIKKVIRTAILKLLNNSLHLFRSKSQTCISLQKRPSHVLNSRASLMMMGLTFLHCYRLRL